MMLRPSLLLPLAVLATACSQGDDSPPQEEAPQQEETPAPPLAEEDEAETLPGEEPRYTRLDDCEEVRSAPEEAGFFEYECAGEGEYRLRLIQADERENITVLAPDGAEHGLHLPGLADGAFSSLGDRVEWRGIMEDGAFAPTALILRQSVMEDPDPEVPEVSYLLAVRLTDTPCVIARIDPGPEQNLRAREAADAGGECLPPPGA